MGLLTPTGTWSPQTAKLGLDPDLTLPDGIYHEAGAFLLAAWRLKKAHSVRGHGKCLSPPCFLPPPSGPH